MHHNTGETWDVLTLESVAPDSLWVGYSVARQLAAAGRRGVRLFVEDVGRLAAQVEGIDRELWIQRHGLFDVYSMELAGVLEPASCAVQVHGSPVPGNYARRLFGGARRRWLAMLHAFDNPLAQASDTLSWEGGITIQHVQQGVGDHACFAKDARSLALLRGCLRRQPAARAAGWAALGQPEPPQEAAFVVLLAGVAPGVWSGVIGALAELDTVVHVVLDWDGAARAPYDEAPGGHRRLTIGLLPAPTWAQWDKAIGLSSLVVTGSECIALRGIQSGCPILWAPRAGGPGGGRLGAWYVQQAEAEFAPVLQDLFAALAAPDPTALTPCIRRYLRDWAAVEAVAATARARMDGARDAIEVIAAVSGVDPSQRSFAGWGEFAPTIPVQALRPHAAAAGGG